MSGMRLVDIIECSSKEHSGSECPNRHLNVYIYEPIYFTKTDFDAS